MFLHADEVKLPGKKFDPTDRSFFYIYIGKIAARFSLYVDVLRVLYVAACAKLILPHSPVPCYPAQASKVAGHFWSPMAQMA